ncbi:glycosyltransferase family 9 protein [Sulfurovum sp.]|uniref:glycosyltransferase family 9 protein n=1 Tax=Sulfurovum sp. TaxID=1969726 RepID=UPI003563F47B
MIDSKNDIGIVLTLMPDCHIGNLVVSLPALVALRDHYQNIPHYFIIDSAFKEIVETLIDPKYTLFYPRRAIRQGNIFKRAWIYVQFMRRVQKLNPDLVIDLEGGATSATIAKICGAKIRLSKKYPGRPSVYTHKAEMPEGKHKVFDYNAIAAATGASVSDEMFRFFPDSHKKEKVDFLLKQAGVDFAKPLVVIHPGAGRLQKLWTISGFVEVVDWLTLQGCQVVFVGGPAEVERAEEVIANLARPVFSFAGKLSLGELLPLLERSTVFLGNDSGPMHMAAAMGIPVVAMFSYADDLEWGPRSEHFVVLRGQDVCVPCVKKKCTDPRCINTLSPGLVKGALGSFLGGNH